MANNDPYAALIGGQQAAATPTPPPAAAEPNDPYGPLIQSGASSKGAVSNIGAGFYKGLGEVAGAPVDLATSGINAASRLAGDIGHATGLMDPNTKAPQIEHPLGGSEDFLSTMKNAGIDTEPDPDSLFGTAGKAAANAIGVESAIRAGMLDAAKTIPKVGRVLGKVADSVKESLGTFSPASTAVNVGAAATGAPAGQAAADQLPKDSPWRPLVEMTGNIVGGAPVAALPAAGRAAGMGLKAIKNVVEPFTASGPELLAADRLNRASSDPAAVRDSLDNPPPDGVPGSNLTTFQQTGDDKLGQLERWAAIKNPEAFKARAAQQNMARVAAIRGQAPFGNPAAVSDYFAQQLKNIDDLGQQAEDLSGQLLSERKDAVGDAVSDVGGTRYDKAATYGSEIRQQLLAATRAEKTRVSALWNAIDPDGTLTYYSQPLRDVKDQILGSVRPTQRAPTGEEAAIYDAIDQLPEHAPWVAAKDLRSRITTEIRNQIRTGRTNESEEVARLSRLKNGLDGALQESITQQGPPSAETPEINPISQGTLDKYETARLGTMNYKNLYRSGPVGEAIAPGTAPFRAQEADVAGKFFNGKDSSPQAIENLVQALGGDRAKALDTLSDYAAFDMRRKAMVNGTLDPKKFATWLTKHQSALTAMPDLRAKFATIERANQSVAEAQANVDEAAQLHAQKVKEFQTSAAKNFLGHDPALAVAKAFSGDSAANFKQLMALAAADRSGDATEGLKRAVIEHIMRTQSSTAEAGTTGIEQLKTAGYQNFINKNELALRTVFGDAGFANLRAVATDLQRANRSITSTKLPGGSNTPQDMAGRERFGKMTSMLEHLLTEGGFAALGTKLAGPIGAGAGFLAGRQISNARQAAFSKADDLVIEAMLDPAKAKVLLTKISPPNKVNAPLWEKLRARLAGLGIQGATGAADTGSRARGGRTGFAGGGPAGLMVQHGLDPASGPEPAIVGDTDPGEALGDAWDSIKDRFSEAGDEAADAYKSVQESDNPLLGGPYSPNRGLASAGYGLFKGLGAGTEALVGSTADLFGAAVAGATHDKTQGYQAGNELQNFANYIATISPGATAFRAKPIAELSELTDDPYALVAKKVVAHHLAHLGRAGLSTEQQESTLAKVERHLMLYEISKRADEAASRATEALAPDAEAGGMTLAPSPAPHASGGRTGLQRAFHELKENPPAILAHTAKKFGAHDANKQRIAIAFSKARQGFAGGGLAGQTLVGPDDTPPDDIGVPPQFRPQAENDHAQQIYDDNFSSPTLSGLLSPEPGWDYSSVLPVAHRDVYQGGPKHQSATEYKMAWPGSLTSLAQGTADLVMGGDRQPMSDNPDAMSIASGGLMSNQMEEPMLAWGLRGIGQRGDPNTLGMFNAWHGSPHTFDAFDASKIGTGEGAQAYGHGLYFAENPWVAKIYQSRLAKQAGTQGHLYETEIDAEPEHFLDWDKPLGQQDHPAVPAILARGVSPTSTFWHNDLMNSFMSTPEGASGSLKDLNIAATNFLRDKGVPGIRYLDQGSRVSDDLTHNYVVFDPKRIKIVKRHARGGRTGLNSGGRTAFAGGGLAGQTLVGVDDRPPDSIGVPPQFRPRAENDHAQQIYDDNFSSPTLSGLLSPEPGWDYSSVLPVAHRDVYQGGPLHQSATEYKMAWPSSLTSLAQGTADLVMGGDRQPMSDNPDAMSIASGGLMSNQMEEPMLAWGLRGIGQKGDPNTLGMFAGQKAKVGPASPKDWFTGVEGARKFEVPDYGSNINPEVMDAAREKLIQNRLAAVPRRARDQDARVAAGKYVDDHVGTDVQLGDFLNHDRLYAQYPELPNIRVSSMTMPRGYRGAFIPPGTEGGGRYGRLLVNAQALRDNPQDVHSTVLHELQHYIQDKEGFSSGANLQAAAESLDNIRSARFAAASDPSLTPEARAQAAEDAQRLEEFLGYDKGSIYTAYHNTAGEVEARNVQARFKKQQSMVGDPQADLFSETPAQVAKRFDYARQFEQGQPLSKVGVSPSRTADVAAERQFVWEPGQPNAGLKLSLDDGLAAGEPKAAARNSITTQSLRGLPMDEATQLAESGVHLRQNPTTGQYVGGPRGVDSGAKLDAIRRGFDQALAIGVPGRDWYEASQGTIHDITGSDPQRMGLAANEFAHWSPQSTPETNLGFALKAHNAYEAGAPADIVRTGAQVRAYNEARDAGGLPKLGQKTGIFGEHLDPNAEDPSTGTNDIWHARAFGFTNHDGGPFDRALTAQEHAFLDGETVLATQRANANGIGGHTDWTPGKVQAAAWVGRKAMNLMDKGMRQEDAVAKSMPDFSTYLDKHTANATYEAVPGAGTGHLQSLLSATPDERAAYSADPRSSWATAPGGRDAIYDAMGMYVRPTQQATGFFTPHGRPPETNPASVARPLVDYAQDARGHAQMSPVSEGMLNAGEATRAYIDAQNMGAWHKMLPEGPASAGPAIEQNSAHIPLKRQLSRDEMLRLADIMGPRNLTPVDTGHGVSLMNFGDGPSAKDMPKLLRGDLGKQIKGVLPDAGLATRARLLSNAIDYQGNFAAKNEGKGLATRQLFSQLNNKAIPAVMGKLDASPAIREAAGARLARDAEYSSKTGDPVRKDIQNARRILQEGGLTGLRAALARKEYLPAIAAGGLGLGALSLQDQQNQD